MTSSNYAYRTFDDIVFEGRNREYGAYLLRKVYTRHLWRALVTGISVFVLFLSIPLLVNKFSPPEPDILVLPKPDTGLTVITEVVLPDEPVIPPPVADPKPPVPKAQVKVERFTPPVITNKPTAETDVPDQQTLSTSTIGTKTEAGDPTAKPPVIDDTPTTGTGTGEAAPTVLFSADKMPEYPGGLAAMKKFLANNTVYPSRARQMGLEGTVLVSFVVNQNGDISGIQVLKSPGMGIEEEAVRVLKSMPKWTPGMNNGVPVNVRFTLPITFAIR